MQTKLYKWLRGLLFLIGLLLGGLHLLAAQVYEVRDVPNVVRTDSLRLTSDPGGLLDGGYREVLDRKLVRLRQQHGVETAVVVLPSIGARDIDGFANELFRSWGIGDKADNSGLLILLVIDQKLIRVEVGYGLEGVLTDALCAQIQRRAMLPYIKKGSYGDALIAGIDAIDAELSTSWRKERNGDQKREKIDGMALWLCYLIFVAIAFVWFVSEQRLTLARANSPHKVRQMLPEIEQSYRSAGFIFLILCFPIAIIIYASWLYYRQGLRALAQKCEHCGQAQVALLSARERAAHLRSGEVAEELIGSSLHRVYACASCHRPDVVKDLNPGSAAKLCPSCGFHTLVLQKPYRVGGQIARVERRCIHCSHRDHEDFHIQEDNGAADVLSGIILSGLWGAARSSGRGFGGGFSGGGFSGGSFGGGSSGGGGATSGW